MNVSRMWVNTQKSVSALSWRHRHMSILDSPAKQTSKNQNPQLQTPSPRSSVMGLLSTRPTQGSHTDVGSPACRWN